MARLAENDNRRAPLPRLTGLRALAAVALVAMAVSLIVDAAHGRVGHFGLDGMVGFYALLGLASGLVIIGVAKGLSVALSRPDTYYDDKSEAPE